VAVRRRYDIVVHFTNWLNEFLLSEAAAMKKKKQPIPIFMAIVLAETLHLCCAFAWADTLQRGVNLPLWNSDVDMTQLGLSLDRFKADGGTSVAVNVTWFQDNINSTSIAPNFNMYSANDATVIATIQAIHARGMSVTLKPLVDLANDSNDWRGEIVGGTNWFNGTSGYRAFMNHWAGIAAQNNVQMLDIGTELGGTTSQASGWRSVVSDVRSQGFTGKLTYSANAGDPAIGENVAWWDAMDYIGIDAYYPLTSQNDPPLATLQSAWASRAGQINSWWNALPANQKKPVLFTEVGYCSQTGTNIEPWNWNHSSTPDQQEQANCYTALLSQLWGKQSWFQGTYWWNWDVNLHPGDTLGYPPEDKLAEQVMRQYYVIPGDTNRDGTVNAADIDAIYHNFGAAASSQWKVYADSNPVGQEDVTYELQNILHCAYGDANLDGKVDFTDFQVLLDHWQNSGAGWATGDFTGNGKVDFADFQKLLDNWNPAGAQSPVPEPATLCLLSLGGLALIKRRR
jgi:hypothetical protein